MFSKGEKIVYGKTGVCEVMDITEMTLPGNTKKELYYSLKPLYQQGSTIFTPVNNSKIAMRSVISKEDAVKLIELIPKIKAEPFKTDARRDLVEHYEKALGSLDCKELIEVTMSIYAKKQLAEKNKKSVGILDEKFMKKAEELLFGELAVALDIDKEEVPKYIAEMIED